MSTGNSSKLWSYSLSVLALCALYFIIGGSPAQAQSDASVPLNGTWLMHAGDDKSWSGTTVDETSWQKVQEPGAQLAPGFNWLRFHFTVPAEWASDPPTLQIKMIQLHLGAIHGAAWVYFNSYFTINTIGTMPTTADGTGYKAVDPTDDFIAPFPVATPIKKGGLPVDLLNFGAENVIAIRIYNPESGPNPSDGPLMLTRPTYSDIYPVTTLSDSQDHLFTSESPVKLSVHFENSTSDTVPLTWQVAICDESGAPVPGLAVAPVDDTIHASKIAAYAIPPIPLPEPGVYRFVIHSKIDNQTLPDKTFAAGYDVGKIHLAEDPPADLSAFWGQVVNHAQATPTHAVLTKTGDADGVTTYQIKYDGFDGSPAHAWLSVPDDVRSSPVEIVHLPGYDSDPTQPDMRLSKKGYVVLDFIATAPDWTSGNANQQYMSTGISSQHTFIMRSIEGNVIRAVGILRSDPELGISGTPKIVLWGESQGGGLALITAGLLGQAISGVVAISPYFTDMPQALDMARPDDGGFGTYFAAHPDGKRAIYKTFSYFDTVNFAPKITAPTFIGVGLLDPIAPPSTAFALANKLTASHTTDITVDGGHVPHASEGHAETWLASKVK